MRHMRRAALRPPLRYRGLVSSEQPASLLQQPGNSERRFGECGGHTFSCEFRIGFQIINRIEGILLVRCDGDNDVRLRDRVIHDPIVHMDGFRVLRIAQTHLRSGIRASLRRATDELVAIAGTGDVQNGGFLIGLRVADKLDKITR